MVDVLVQILQILGLAVGAVVLYSLVILGLLAWFGSRAHVLRRHCPAPLARDEPAFEQTEVAA